jgi:hypothetical protein
VAAIDGEAAHGSNPELDADLDGRAPQDPESSSPLLGASAMEAMCGPAPLERHGHHTSTLTSLHEFESEERGARVRWRRKGGVPGCASRALAEEGMGAGAPSLVGEGSAGWRGWGERADEDGAEAQGEGGRVAEERREGGGGVGAAVCV